MQTVTRCQNKSIELDDYSEYMYNIFHDEKLYCPIKKSRSTRTNGGLLIIKIITDQIFNIVFIQLVKLLLIFSYDMPILPMRIPIITVSGLNNQMEFN